MPKSTSFAKIVIGAAFGGAMLAAAPAQALVIDVLQGGTFLGTVTDFTGAVTGNANYSFSSDSGHPISGPTPQATTAFIFFYTGSDGLNFNVIAGADGNAPSGSGFTWSLSVAGSTTDPSVRRADDGGEVSESGGTNTFNLNFAYGNNSDGGVIGEIGGTAWTIDIDPSDYHANPTALRVASGSGGFIDLSLATDTTGNIQFRVAEDVPEPATLGLLGTALTGLGVIRRRRRTRQNT